ncbi:MAG: dephospho-CoA kinase [Clostridiaceae bacterium]
MLRVGITGGIGSGKSTVASYIKKKGYPVIDADESAREVLLKHPEINDYILKEYGPTYFKDGNLLRKKFGELVFNSPLKLKKYQSVIMPYIINDIVNEFLKLEKAGYKIAFVDAPLLFEESERLKVDLSVVVDVEPELQVKRVLARDKSTRQDIEKRMKNQMSREEKLERGDFILKNEGTLRELYEKTETLLSELLRRADEKEKQGIE